MFGIENGVIKPTDANRMTGQDGQPTRDGAGVQPTVKERPFFPSEGQIDAMTGNFDYERKYREQFAIQYPEEYKKIVEAEKAKAGIVDPGAGGGQPGRDNNFNPNEINRDGQPTGRTNLQDAAARAAARLRGLDPVKNTGVQPTRDDGAGNRNLNDPANVRDRGGSFEERLRGSLSQEEFASLSSRMSDMRTAEDRNRQFLQIAKDKGYDPNEFANELKSVTPERMIEWIARDRRENQAGQAAGPGLTNLRDTGIGRSPGDMRAVRPKW